MALSSVLDALPSSIGPSFAMGVLILCLWSLRSYLRLCRVPGPSLAAISNLPRVSWVLSNRAHDFLMTSISLCTEGMEDWYALDRT